MGQRVRAENVTPFLRLGRSMTDNSNYHISDVFIKLLVGYFLPPVFRFGLKL